MQTMTALDAPNKCLCRKMVFAKRCIWLHQMRKCVSSQCQEVSHCLGVFVHRLHCIQKQLHQGMQQRSWPSISSDGYIFSHGTRQLASMGCSILFNHLDDASNYHNTYQTSMMYVKNCLQFHSSLNFVWCIGCTKKATSPQYCLSVDITGCTLTSHWIISGRLYNSTNKSLR